MCIHICVCVCMCACARACEYACVCVVGLSGASERETHNPKQPNTRQRWKPPPCNPLWVSLDSRRPPDPSPLSSFIPNLAFSYILLPDISVWHFMLRRKRGSINQMGSYFNGKSLSNDSCLSPPVSPTLIYSNNILIITSKHTLLLSSFFSFFCETKDSD